MSETTAISDVMDYALSTPSGWEFRKLGELGDVKTGLTYKPDDVANHGTLVLRSSNIQNERLAFDDNVFVSKNVGEGATVQKGDILICVRNGSRRLIGKSAMINDEAHGVAFGAFMSAFRSELNPYLIWLFQSSVVQRQIEENLGATINQITNATLKGLLVPVPPLHEQQAIAAALSDADGVVAGLERVIAKKRLIKQGAMQDLLTARRRLPGFSGEWEEVSVGEVILKSFCGPSPTCEERMVSGDEWGVLKTTAITVEAGWDWSKHKVLPRMFWGNQNALVECDDVIVTKAGPRHRVGVAASVDFVPRNILVSGKMIGLRPNPQRVTPLMLSSAISAKQTQSYLDQRSTGMAESQVNFNNSDLLLAPIKLPQIQEQQAISRISSDMDAEIQTLESRLTKARAVKEGMMQNLLTGRVRLV